MRAASVRRSRSSIANDLVTPHSMALVLQRLRGASTGGTVTGLHGTNIVSVKAIPAARRSRPAANPITATPGLTFAVTVQDSGDFQEVHIPVTLTITGGSEPEPDPDDEDDPADQPGRVQGVEFTNLGAVSIATQHTLQVDVKPVAGEANKSNNSAQYPIILSLPG